MHHRINEDFRALGELKTLGPDAIGVLLVDLFEHANDAIFVANAKTRCVVAANLAAASLLGRSIEELVSLSVLELHPAADLKWIGEEFERQQRHKYPVAFNIPLQRKDGTVVYSDINAFPVSVGEHELLVGFFRDATERRATEEREREATARLQTFRETVNQGPGVVFRWRMTAQGPEVDLMTENIAQFGYSADDFTSGKLSLADVTHADDLARIVSEVEAFIAEGALSFSQEYRMITRDGEVRHVEDFNRVVRDDAGELAYVEGIVLDVTRRCREHARRRESEERLRRLAVKLATAQDEEQRRIAEGLHDDIGQVLTGCRLKLEAAKRSGDGEATGRLQDEAGALLQQAVERIRNLSFELSSPTLDRLGLQPAIEELCDGMGERYDVRFVVDSDTAVGVFDGAAATMLFKVARELLFNVVKHAGTKEANVSLARDDGHVTLEVEDAGRGFPVGFSDAEIGSGLGFGLLAARERIHDLGGELRVESTPGVCTRVTVRVPVRAPTP